VASGIDRAQRADVLIEALPYLRRFAGGVVVIKYGGNALAGGDESSALASFARDVALLQAVGLRPVVVHGGGPQINALLERLGKVPQFHEGLRVTDAETMEVVGMVLLGQVNPRIVSAINVNGGRAAGVSGQDMELLLVRQRDPQLGFVGEIVSVQPKVITDMLDDGVVPVIATVGVDAHGDAYNVNADTAASAIAVALGAMKILFLTDVVGVLLDRNDPGSLVGRLTPVEIDALTKRGVIAGGMIPKLASCIDAVNGGVAAAHILDGRVDHAVLLELLTDEGVGTMVVADPASRGPS
jgi:acetylglutamate kinase